MNRKGRVAARRRGRLRRSGTAVTDMMARHISRSVCHMRVWATGAVPSARCRQRGKCVSRESGRWQGRLKMFGG